MVSSGVTLRHFNISDVDDFMVWETDEEVTPLCTWEVYKSREETETYIRSVAISHPWYKAISLDGKAIENRAAQDEEMEVLQSIYGSDFTVSLEERYCQGQNNKFINKDCVAVLATMLRLARGLEANHERHILNKVPNLMLLGTKVHLRYCILTENSGNLYGVLNTRPWKISVKGMVHKCQNYYLWPSQTLYVNSFVKGRHGGCPVLLLICSHIPSCDDRYYEDLKSLKGVRVIPLEENTEFDLDLHMTAYFPESYPSSSPPIAELKAPWLQESTRERLNIELGKLFDESIGDVVMFRWIEWLKAAPRYTFILSAGRLSKMETTCCSHQQVVPRS
eukprot:Gb_27692 [translate_table: standard]